MTGNVQIVDNQLVVVLPPAVAQRLNAQAGSKVSFVASPNGVELIEDAEHARQLEIARGVMKDDREALGELAK